MIAESEAEEAFATYEGHLRIEIKSQCPVSPTEAICVIASQRRLLDQYMTKLKHKSRREHPVSQKNPANLLEQKAKVLLEKLLAEREHVRLQETIAEKTKQLSVIFPQGSMSSFDVESTTYYIYIVEGERRAGNGSTALDGKSRKWALPLRNGISVYQVGHRSIYERHFLVFSLFNSKMSHQKVTQTEDRSTVKSENAKK